MPLIDGRQALIAIRIDEWLSAIPVMAFATSDVAKPPDLDEIGAESEQINCSYTGVSALLPPGRSTP